MVVRIGRPSRWIVASVAALLAGAALGGSAGAVPRQAKDACGIPTTAPVWIDYAEGSVAPDVRALFAQPGVVVTASGTVIPKTFRDRGAATTYFELHLPTLVGQPADPNEPTSIDATADALFQRASVSTACATPIVALNELFGESAKTPWSPTTTAYRANVLELMKRLHDRGARPVLFVHGDPNTDGAAADWWRQVASVGSIVYELYFSGARLSELGPVLGARRVREGGRSFVSQFHGIGIDTSKLGIALGFHSALTAGIGGRQGLQPVAAWLRVVKWEAIAAAQVAKDTGLASIWSWGWALFGANDPDKLVTACAYLWARDPKLCDAPTKAGPAFNASRTEGQIVLPAGASCTFAGGAVETSAVDRLAAVLHSRRAALSAAFARAVLQSQTSVSDIEVARVEQSAISRFRGKRRGYLEALTRSHATLAVAHEVIRDELRRRATAQKLASSGGGETTLQWTAEHEASAVATAICLHDQLPGSGDFPLSENREVGVIPVLQKLPFLFADRTAPTVPSTPVAAPAGPGIVALSWSYGTEPDLAGYRVYRSSTSGGPYQPVGPFLDRPAFVDATVPHGATMYYVVRAVDTSGNISASSAEVGSAARTVPMLVR
jgi:hypothetical protein